MDYHHTSKGSYSFEVVPEVQKLDGQWLVSSFAYGFPTDNTTNIGEGNNPGE